MAFNLTDEQWAILDLLMRAKERGVTHMHRQELLFNPVLPQGVSIKLTMAALLMPKELIEWRGEHEFSITEMGAQLYRFQFSTKNQPAQPSRIADAVICLPDLSGRSN